MKAVWFLLQFDERINKYIVQDIIATAYRGVQLYLWTQIVALKCLIWSLTIKQVPLLHVLVVAATSMLIHHFFLYSLRSTITSYGTLLSHFDIKQLQIENLRVGVVATVR
ncbi:hypothetical protein EDD16DRAFT_1793630 [Pisolithus croceorrhizus]|nr:hypothetical protein EDD16DRAFT_1793630 [Pisolithus croceorrhizus]